MTAAPLRTHDLPLRSDVLVRVAALERTLATVLARLALAEAQLARNGDRRVGVHLPDGGDRGRYR